MDFNDDDYLIDQQFREWLKQIRVKKGFKLPEVARYCQISVQRLTDLEDGLAEVGINEREIKSLSQILNIDPRAIQRKAIYGDMD